MKILSLAVTLIIGVLFSLCSNAQDFTRINGKIKVEGNLICLYKEIGIDNLNQKSRDTGFKDVAFYTTDSLPVIYMEARALSTLNKGNIESLIKYGRQTNRTTIGESRRDPYTLRNYYRIEFAPLEEHLNIMFREETLYYFMKDLVWYGVFQNGQFNDKGAKELIQRWKKKMDFIDTDTIKAGLSMGYLSNNFWRLEQDTMSADIKFDFTNRSVFKNDTTIATYIVERIPEFYSTKGLVSSYCPHYIISNRNGSVVADIYSNEFNNYGMFTIHPEKHVIYFPLVNKCEQQQVEIAIDALIRMNKL